MTPWLANRAGLAGLAAPLSGDAGDWPALWWLAAGAGLLAAIATLASMVLVLQNLVRRTQAGSSDAPERAAGLFAEMAAVQERRLTEVAETLTGELRQSAGALAEELGKTPRPAARSWSKAPGVDLEPSDAPSRCWTLRREIVELAGGERRRLAAGLAAASQLGEWIECLWPVLETAAGRDAHATALPGPAAAECRSADRILRDYCRCDAGALRHLGRLVNGDSGNGSRPAAAGFFERSGLIAGERPLPERLRRYLEPFDHLGRLGEVTLALQYLLEAFPVEQLSRDQRSRLRRKLVAAVRDAGLEPDFHLLVTRIAAGVGLRYRPVRYYQSRTDQSEYAFVRQQVSPISLSERVGYDATAERQVIVRLERPFFAQMSSDIYHAGHAHVARG